jgi:hypothetical protein
LEELSTAIVALVLLATAAGWWLALTDLGRRHDLVGRRKATAALVILLLPLLGALTYYAFRPPIGSSRPRFDDAYVDDPYASEQLAVVTALRQTGALSALEYEHERAALDRLQEAARRPRPI